MQESPGTLYKPPTTRHADDVDYLLALSDALNAEHTALAIQSVAIRQLSSKLGHASCQYIQLSDVPAGRYQQPSDIKAQALERLQNSLPNLLIDTSWNGLCLGKTLATPAAGLRHSLVVPHVHDGVATSALLVDLAAESADLLRTIGLAAETLARLCAAVQRARLFDEMKTRERRFSTLFNSMNEGFCIIERTLTEPMDFRYVDGNPAFFAFSGHVDMMGRSLRESFAEESIEAIKLYNSVLETGQPIRFEYAMPNMGYELELHAFKLPDANERQVAVLFNDITERKKAEHLLRNNQRKQTYLLKLSDALREHSDAAALKRAACRVLREFLDVGQVLCLEPDGQALLCLTAQYGKKGVAPLDAAHALAQPGMQDSLRAGEPIVRPLGMPPANERDGSGRAMHAQLAVPLRKGQHTVLAMWLVDVAPRFWGPFEMELASETAERTWSALQRAQTETALINAEQEKMRLQLEDKNQLEVFQTSLQTLEEERNRIAGNLHDGIGQNMYGIKLSLNRLSQAMTPEEFGAAKTFTDRLLTKSISEIRRVSHELMPTTLEHFGLKSAIQHIAKELDSKTRFTSYIRLPKQRLEKFLELAIYRTVQELATNIVKHAEASLAMIRISSTASVVKIEVSDNGKGISTGGEQTGIGLEGIRSKIKLLNGEVHIESAANRGTQVYISIPVLAEQESTE